MTESNFTPLALLWLGILVGHAESIAAVALKTTHIERPAFDNAGLEQKSLRNPYGNVICDAILILFYQVLNRNPMQFASQFFGSQNDAVKLKRHFCLGNVLVLLKMDT